MDALLDWYAANARDLPWRHTKDPYAILVAEVMLQQTQVARVVPRYERWLDRWPSARALAAASLPDVLREWSGLGYNTRARRLRDACAVVARDGWPDDLCRLPGVGPYTAAAVACFAFGEVVAPVDTNVRRVGHRLGRDPQALMDAAGDPLLGQALMELGAVVCRARTAECGRCPLARDCPSRGTVRPHAPAPARARERFADSDRYARGRVVAALAAGEPLPTLDADRLERALAGLERDGLVVRRGAQVDLAR